MQDNKFYNYVYLDPRKPGDYNYGEFHFDYEPFYVGKGCYNRIYKHLNKDYKSKNNSKKLNKINKIRKEGLEPIALKVFEDLEESLSFDNEIRLISIIGRHDKGLGPLTNLTNGGEGNAGYKCSDEIKLFRSNRMKGDKNIMFNKNHNKNTINKIKLKALINNKGFNNPNTVKYIIKTPENEILEIISYKKVLETLGCSKRFLVSKKYKGYLLIEKIKINA